MKQSVLSLVFAVVAHLFIIDAILLLIPDKPLIQPYFVMGYNGVWLIMALSIWKHKYDMSKG